MAKVTKLQKRKWHDEMRQRACDYSHGICSSCRELTDISHGVIHHLAYPAGVYKIDVEILIDKNICIWLCKECHQKIHYTDNLAKSSAGKLNGGKCHFCGRICYGGWDRAKTLGITQCICSECHQARKKREKLIQQGRARMMDENEFNEFKKLFQ
jgi:hypothetical protein